MRTEQFADSVRGQNCAQGWTISGVGLKHLLDQIVHFIGQVFGQGRVRAPTHLKNQALPAGRLELDEKSEGMRY